MDAELSPLLTTFNGFLRYHKPINNNVWGDAAFRLAFPKFDPHKWSTQEMDQLRAHHKNIDHLMFAENQQRRWGGYDLPRGRYYSVCVNENGNDQGTLAAELRAYRDTSVHDVIVESVDGHHFPASAFNNPTFPEAIREAKDSSIMVSIFPAAKLRQTVENSGVEVPGSMSAQLSTLTDDTLIHVMLLPLVERTAIPAVVDLRLPATREHFFRLFQVGRTASKGASFSRPLGNNISSFFEMLPELIDLAYGGGTDPAGGITQAIGCYLRGNGVSGIVYPSARNDCGANIHRGELMESWGWNFVDLQNAPAAMKSWVCVSPWQKKVMKDVTVHVPPLGEFAGSFKITGLYKANTDVYEQSYSAERRALLDRINRRLGIKVVLLYGTTNLDALGKQS
jgi:hypothetical protein